LCGIDIPRSVQGQSYLHLLEGVPGSERQALFYEVNMEKEGPERFPIPERGVRTKKWLYVRTENAPKLLIDRESDPHELNNLVNEPSFRDIIVQLDKLLADHMKRTSDDWSAEAVFPPSGFLTHEVKTDKQKRLIEEAVIEP